MPRPLTEIRVALLSGPIGAGKTTLAEALVERGELRRLFTRDAILQRLPDTPRSRVNLQEAGERLDRETRGTWVTEELQQLLAADAAAQGVVVDAVMVPEQITAIRSQPSWHTLHVHLTAPLTILAARYLMKRGSIAETADYSHARANLTEARVNRLAHLADLVIDTSTTPFDDEVRSVLSRLVERR